ncbi:MAG: hypothetical protein U9N84_04395 [Actinomycetota bacterium]|nr:hypothetical protein [Actinomycetota bacterium]
MVSAKAALIVTLVLVAAACGSPDTSAESTATVRGDGPVTIPNQGGTSEGHTPTGFPGSGTGLFAGDNLNPSFPEGVGVQTFLTFALPADLTIGSATLTSDALHTTGSPFDDLGPLLAEPVVYTKFGPELFDLPSSGQPIRCEVTADTIIECDVTAAVQDAVDGGVTSVQFRLRFERPADNDGNPDLALFYRSDSNTNEPALFNLTINTAP